jgi:hypothetical protein
MEGSLMTCAMIKSMLNMQSESWFRDWEGATTMRLRAVSNVRSSTGDLPQPLQSQIG